MWSISQKDFWVLEVLCQERNRAARKIITTELNPYTPSEDIAKTIETMGKISDL
jgi:hypothetical protein